MSIGTHFFLTSLEIIVNIDRYLTDFFRRLLVSADMPALRQLVVGLIFVDHRRRTACEFQLEIYIPPLRLPILSEAVAQSLHLLTFRFDGYSDQDITINNWVQFQNLFKVPANSDIFQYEIGSNCGRLPRLH
jgi:hypothetical protein